MRVVVTWSVICTLLFVASHIAVGATPTVSPLPGPPLASVLDGNGVDLITGDFLYSRQDVSIGGQDGGLARIIYAYGGDNFTGAIYNSNTAYNALYAEQIGGLNYYTFTISYANQNQKFKYSAQTGEFVPLTDGGSLTCNSVVCTYTLQDGTVVSYVVTRLINSVIIKAVIKSITKPSGEVISITYPSATPTEGKILSVSSSLGWLLKYEYSPTSKVSAINTSVEYCSPTASTCAGVTLLWPYTNYKGVTFPSEVTNALGDTTRLSYVASYSPCNSLNFPCLSADGLPSPEYPYLAPLSSPFYPAYKVTSITSPIGVKKSINHVPDPYSVSTGDWGGETTGGDPHWVGSYQQTGGGQWSYNFQTAATNPNFIPGYQVATVTDPNGGVRTVTYSGIQTGIVNNQAYRFAGAPGIESDTDQFGRKRKYFYEFITGVGAKISGISGPDSTYDGSGLPLNKYTKYSYDARGNIVEVRLTGAAADTPLIMSATYPEPGVRTCSNFKTCNNPLTITSQNGVTTTYTYHQQSGNIETITKPAVNGVQPQTRYKYEQKNPYVKNSSGNLIANPAIWVLTEISECMTSTLNSCVNTSDEKRVVYSNFTNNLLAQTTTVQDGTGTVKMEALTEYDIYGNVIAVDGPRTGTDDKVFYFYNALHHKIGEIGVDPDGTGLLPRQAIRTNYNPDEKVSSVEKGIVYGTTKADLDSMTVKQKTTIEYSPVHGLPAFERFYAVGVLEKVTQKSYDNMFRLECVAQRLNRNAWSSLPSSACTLGAVGTEGNDRITKYTYDATGAVVSTISAFGTSLQRTDRTNTYSPVNGLLTSETDPKGNVTAYKYDDFNRLFKTVYPTPSNGTVESTTDYTQTNYKPGSSLVNSVRLRDGLTINFSEYDALGRVKTKSGALSESFTYNNFNQVASHTNNSTGGVSQTSTYVFNSLGWLKSETRVAGGVSLGSVSYGHDSTGRRTTLTWPDFVFVKYDYNVNGTPSEYLRKITESNGTLLAQFDYYDNGRRKSLTRGNGVVTSYDYNNLYQLKTQSTDVGGSNTADDITETFTYAQSGQLKTHLLNVANANYKYTPSVAAATNYVPDALNRIASVNGASFGYDGRGNLTQDNTGTTYTYNANNLLLNATKSGVTTTLSYDAENRLYYVAKSGAATKFMYDGTDLIAETSASNGILRRYVHGPETDDPIVWYEGSGTTDKRYYTANRQGSIVGVTLQNGLSTSVNSYDEYGIQKLSTIGRFQYTGQTWIPEIGLYYYKARLYSPSLGRFMQTDPIGYKDGMNWYAYVGGDPINMTDPTGMYGYWSGMEEMQQTAEANGQAEVARTVMTTAMTSAIGGGVGGNVAVKTASAYRTYRYNKRMETVRERLKGWKEEPNNKKTGSRFQDPNDRGNRVRVDKGDPNHQLPRQKVDHVVEQKGGKTVDVDGSEIKPTPEAPKPAKTPEAHIPLDEWLKRRWR